MFRVYLIQYPAIPPRGLIDQIPHGPPSFTGNHHGGVPESHRHFHSNRQPASRKVPSIPEEMLESSRCETKAPVRRNLSSRCSKSGRRRRFVFPDLNWGLKSGKHCKVNKKLSKRRVYSRRMCVCSMLICRLIHPNKHAAREPGRNHGDGGSSGNSSSFTSDKIFRHHQPSLMIITLIKPTGIKV